MAVLTCPKCPTTLRIPDGVSGNVKCPKCNTLFPVTEPEITTAKLAPASPPAKPPFGHAAAPPKPPFGHAAAPSKPSFGQPAAPPKPPFGHAAAAKPAPPKAVPPVPEEPEEPDEPDFEIVEEPKPKKKVVTAIDDDEDDEPRTRKKRDDEPRTRKKWDDDEDDEPRARKKRDDDEDDDRPRKKKKSRRYEDDEDDLDDDWQPKSAKKKGHGNARVGALLLTISSWLYFSLYVLFTIGVFLMLVGLLSASDSPGSRSRPGPFSGRAEDIASLINVFMVLIGLIGLGNWIVSLVGFAFCIAGPARTRTGAITATAIAGVHLILVGLTYSIASNMLGGLGRYGGMESPSWLIFATTMPFINSFLPALVYGFRAINGEYVILILTGACEVVRLIFTLLTIRTLANEAKNNAASERAQLGVVVTAAIVGGGVILMLFVALLIVEAKFTNFKAPITIGLGAFFLLCLAYTVMLIIPAVTAGSTQRSLAQRKR